MKIKIKIDENSAMMKHSIWIRFCALFAYLMRWRWIYLYAMRIKIGFAFFFFFFALFHSNSMEIPWSFVRSLRSRYGDSFIINFSSSILFFFQYSIKNYYKFVWRRNADKRFYIVIAPCEMVYLCLCCLAGAHWNV